MDLKGKKSTGAIVPRNEKVIIEENTPILNIDFNENRVIGMDDVSPDFGDVGLFIDKVTEAAKLGTGAFMDFGDLLGLTEDETQELAKSFMLMSLDEINDKISELIDNSEISEDKEDKLLLIFDSLFGMTQKEIETVIESQKKFEEEMIKVITSNREEIRKLLS